MSAQATNQDVNSGSSQFLALQFMIRGLIGQACHVGLARVMAVSNAGSVAPVGTVDALPMVNQVDGAGNPIPHTTIHGLPYFRLQGGTDAIILDPKVGDIGIVVIADRDITNVKETHDIANPGSARRFNWADGLYIGGVLNGTPSQYVEFSTAGIKIHSPTLINLDAPDIQLNAQTIEMVATTSIHATTPTFTITGDLVVSGHIGAGAGANITGAVVATGEGTFNGGHTVSAHTHTQPNDSHGDTEAATNPPTG